MVQSYSYEMDEIKIKPRDMTVRFDTYTVDPWAVSGLFAALNPAEDLFIQLRTGFQVDEYSVRREPRVYKVDLTDAITKSIAVSKLILPDALRGPSLGFAPICRMRTSAH